MQKNIDAFQQSLPCKNINLELLTNQLLAIRNEVLAMEADKTHLTDRVLPAHQNSARNLLHYLALRSQDIRELQTNLIEWGFSSLGRSERKVQATLDTLLLVMHQLQGIHWDPVSRPPSCFREGRQKLEANTEALLGPSPSGRRVRIMVTMPDEAADNYALVEDLLLNGMNVARINCAHGTPELWEKIIENIRKASQTTKLSCHIAMDLGGPKLRTGPIEAGPAVVKSRPKRNQSGEVANPGLVWLFPSDNQSTSFEKADLALPVPKKWLKQLKVGDRVKLKDARGAKRKLRVQLVRPEGCLLSHKKSIYFSPGIQLSTKRKFKGHTIFLPPGIPEKEGYLLLQSGDLLKLRKSMAPGTGNEVGCSIPSVLDRVKTGESIWFDDGKIEGVIHSVEADHVMVEIRHTDVGGAKLRSEKGINLPDSDLRLPALTKTDLADLTFAVRHADIIGLSFVNTAADVDDFIRQIRSLTPNPPGIILKIETRKGFENLPSILLSGMQIPVQGVMIARGDLAIEAGFGRLAEVQEEILWICEAAHVPVIWATQVLEGLAKKKMPSRAEITDAAMGQRAECIMLNKGNHIVAATHALDDILLRMQDHQTKKRSLLRQLQLAKSFFAEEKK